MGEEKSQSSFNGYYHPDHPVVNVSWFDAVEFCNRLSEKTGLKPVYKIDKENVSADLDAKGFRLPTEAEWRYACRAGTNKVRYGEIDQIAWYKGNSNGSTQGVRNKNPNPWGLYHMIGNVHEWCWDWFEDYPTEDKKDWRGPETGKSRITPGGAWSRDANECSCDFRNKGRPAFRMIDVGFRLVRSL